MKPNERSARINRALAIPDDGDDTELIEALRSEDVWCARGRHLVRAGTVRATPTGSSICDGCAGTPDGQRDLTPFNPVDGEEPRRKR